MSVRIRMKKMARGRATPRSIAFARWTSGCRTDGRILEELGTYDPDSAANRAPVRASTASGSTIG